MKLKNLSLIILGCMGFMMVAHANEIVLTANKPIEVTFRVAHQNLGGEPIVGELQTVAVNKNVTIPVNLNNYALAGIVIESADGHELPPSVNRFDQAEQCSMTTDKIKSSGMLEFTVSAHKASCSTRGGIFA